MALIHVKTGSYRAVLACLRPSLAYILKSSLRGAAVPRRKLRAMTTSRQQREEQSVRCVKRKLEAVTSTIVKGGRSDPYRIAAAMRVIAVKLLLLFSESHRPRVTSFSSRSALGRRTMGSGEQGVLICFTTLKAFGPPAPDFQRDRLAHRPTERSCITLAGEPVFLTPPIFVSFHAIAVETGCLL